MAKVIDATTGRVLEFSSLSIETIRAFLGAETVAQIQRTIHLPHNGKATVAFLCDEDGMPRGLPHTCTLVCPGLPDPKTKKRRYQKLELVGKVLIVQALHGAWRGLTAEQIESLEFSYRHVMGAPDIPPFIMVGTR